jgi:hypothetical protein
MKLYLKNLVFAGVFACCISCEMKEGNASSEEAAIAEPKAFIKVAQAMANNNSFKASAMRIEKAAKEYGQAFSKSKDLRFKACLLLAKESDEMKRFADLSRYNSELINKAVLTVTQCN